MKPEFLLDLVMKDFRKEQTKKTLIRVALHRLKGHDVRCTDIRSPKASPHVYWSCRCDYFMIRLGIAYV